MQRVIQAMTAAGNYVSGSGHSTDLTGSPAADVARMTLCIQDLKVCNPLARVVSGGTISVLQESSW